MVGPRCFCSHGLRVEKGVQSVTERCVATHRDTGSVLLKRATASHARPPHGGGARRWKCLLSDSRDRADVALLLRVSARNEWACLANGVPGVRSWRAVDG
jgi:hypothetical protein